MAGPNPREHYNLFNVFAICGVLGGVLGGFISHVVIKLNNHRLKAVGLAGD